jgi:Tol biopolymer transport system component
MYALWFKRSKLLKVSLATIAVTVAACLLAMVVRVEPSKATFPGNNGKIAFRGLDETAGDSIYTVSGEGGIATRVPGTEGSAMGWGFVQDPAYSPDGSELAFTTEDPDGEYSDIDIYTIPAGGGTPSPLLANNTTNDVDPAWSADGESIVYVAIDDIWGTSEVYTVPASGGTPTKLTNNGASPTWSPDGKTIAFSAPVKNGDLWSWQIFTVSASGGTPTKITNNSVHDNVRYFEDGLEANYSPDGQTIAYTQRDPEHSNSDIYTIPATGGSPTNLTQGQMIEGSRIDASGPAWSPDGSRIVFSHFNFPNDGSTFQLYTIPAKGGTPTHLPTISSLMANSPDWGVAAAPMGPKSKDECKKGGYKEFGFKNQGQCIAFVNRAAHNN